MTIIDRTKLKTLQKREESASSRPPKSAALYSARKIPPRRRPMNWMKKWAGAFPVFVKSPKARTSPTRTARIHRPLPRRHRRHDGHSPKSLPKP